MPVNVKVSENYDAHIETIGKDQFEIAYLGPYSYVKMASSYGKKPILGRLEVRERPVFKGKIITKISSNIRRLNELKNKRFAFGNTNSTMSFIVPKALLATEGVTLKNLKSYQHYPSHSAVVKAVLNGEVDAVIAIAVSLGFGLVAEGVETLEQLE